MNVPFRRISAGLAALALVAVLAACKPLDTQTGERLDGTSPDKPSASGLKSDKDRISYVIGTQMGESIAPAKDEIDLDVLVGAMKDAIAGKEPKLSEDEAMQVMMAFGQRMQARQAEEAQQLAQKNLDDGEKFFAENAGKPGVQSTESGLQYQVLTEGKGARPKPTDVIRFHYKGTLLDGTVFDDSYARGEPVQFALNQLVPGWQEGIQLMPVGSKFLLWVPGKLGYGEQGTPGGPIPPNATLAFEIELLDIVK